MHLLRNSGTSAAQEKRAGTQLRWIPLSECRTSSNFRGSSARATAGLVALRRVQRLVLVWIFFSHVCAGSEAACSQSARGAALSAEVEHHSAWVPALLVPLHALYHHHPYSTVASHSRF